MDTRDPVERLSSAYRVEIAEDTKTRHIAEVGAALASVPPMPVPAGFALRRRLAGALAAVFVVAAPVGMAVAADDSVPGDVLYPVKQVAERVRAVFDDEIEATHRVEEVERLVFLRAPRAAITRAVERAESATAELAERDALGSRLEDARRRLQEQDEQERREREAAESRQSSERGAADPQGRAERQGSDIPNPGTQQEGAREGLGGAESGSRQNGEAGGLTTTTTSALSAGSGEEAGDRSAGASAPDQLSQPGVDAGAEESPSVSSHAPEAERRVIAANEYVASSAAGSPSTTLP